MKLKWHIYSIALLAFCCSCTPQTGSSASVDSRDIATEQAINLADCLTQEESNYLIFFHSDACQQCKEIMGDVTEFARLNYIKTYFIDTSKNENKVTLCQPDEVVIGVTSVEHIAIVGTPSFIEVEDGVTVANVAGKNSCLTFMNEQRIKHKL